MLEPQERDEASGSLRPRQRSSWLFAVLLIGACVIFGWFVIGALLRRVFQ